MGIHCIVSYESPGIDAIYKGRDSLNLGFPIIDERCVLQKGMLVRLKHASMVAFTANQSANGNQSLLVLRAWIATYYKQMPPAWIMKRPRRDKKGALLCWKIGHFCSAQSRKHPIDFPIVANKGHRLIGILNAYRSHNSFKRNGARTAIGIFPLWHVLAIVGPIADFPLSHMAETAPCPIKTFNVGVTKLIEIFSRYARPSGNLMIGPII